MVAERLDSSMAADKLPSAPARFAAEASIRAALDSARNNPLSSLEQAATRKNKKKKRNKQRNGQGGPLNATQRSTSQSERSATDFWPKVSLEKTADKDKKTEQSSLDRSGESAHNLPEQDSINAIGRNEVSLDLVTPHEGEINMHDGNLSVIETGETKTKSADRATSETASKDDQAHDNISDTPRVKNQADVAINTHTTENSTSLESSQSADMEFLNYPQLDSRRFEPVKELAPRYQQQPEIQHLARDEPEKTPDYAASEPVYEHEPTPPVPPAFQEFSQIFMDRNAESAESAAAAQIEEALSAGSHAVSPSAANEIPFPTQRYEDITNYPEPATTVMQRAGRYSSETPPGLQRTASEVSQAAWTGLLVGWFIGRRGKRKAIKAAVAKAVDQNRNQSIRSASRLASVPRTPEQFKNPTLEAEPLHHYPTMALHENSRKTIMPLSVETRQSTPDALRKQSTMNRPAKQSETRFSKGSELAPLPNAPNKPVSEMGRGELVKIAKDVRIDGVSLKDVFAAKRIDQEGLRAVVETYLRGGDVKQQLTAEVVVKEQSFERDPFLRHQRPLSRSESRGDVGSKFGAIAAGVTASARSIVQERGTQLAESSQKSASRAKHILANGAKQAHHDIIDNSNTFDWLSITAIVIIYSLILILLLH